MKPIRDLEKALNNPLFYEAQFDESGIIKNILFVSPQLTGKHIYKYISPYFCLPSAKVATAITSVEKYDGLDSLRKPKSRLFPKQVIWADYIVFPFILSQLGGAENSFYQKLKQTNPNVKIVYHVDFNFYLLDKMHPYYKLFNKKTISIVEDNIYFADLCLTSNNQFHELLIKIVNKLYQEKYPDNPPQLKVGSYPILFDMDVLLMNIEYDPESPVKIDNRKVMEVIRVAEQDKKSDEQKNLLTDKTIKKTINGKSKAKTTGARASGKSNGGSTKAKKDTSVSAKPDKQSKSGKRGRPKNSDA